jgi:hypothetical protein
MIFYDNAFRLRIPHTSIYRIHQHLDFFVQERKGRSCHILLKFFLVPLMMHSCLFAQHHLLAYPVKNRVSLRYPRGWDFVHHFHGHFP